MRVNAMAALALTAALVATLSGGALAQSAPASQGAPIRLKALTFNPAAGDLGRTPLGLTRRVAPGGPGYYIVQAPGPITEAWKAAVAGAGAELLDYIPDNAFKVRMTPDDAAALRGLGITSYVGLFHPFYAVSPELAAGRQLVSVTVERGGSRADVEAAVAGAGADLLSGSAGRLVVGADGAQINRIANALDVAWIEPFRLVEKHNSSAGEIVGATGGQSGGARARGYDGSTQIAAVADTGIGGGTATTAHRDIPSSRVVAIYNWAGTTDSCFQTIQNDGAQDVDSGHGTHVAGSVLAGGDPAGFGTGIAPAARLVFQATENYVITSSLCKNLYGYPNDYYLTGLPTDLNQLFQQAYAAGARVHANSWGSAAAGAYTSNSVSADQFIWNNRDMTITFSAGNEGIDANADGVIDNDSIGAPATAKNVITIGASENKGDAAGNFPCDSALAYQSRDAYQPTTTCAGMGGNNLLGTYGQRWPADYPANPIASDLSGGNQEQMAAFSSRGPTDDGRIKPDVVAPGTWILSTYANLFQEGYDPSANPQNGSFQSDGWGMPRNGFYKYFGGTSMSNPIAAGGAVVVRDFYQKAYGAGASAALVKATLINTAVDLLDENNDGVNDNDFPIPNVHEGWGRINLDNATDGSEQYFDVTAGLSTGGSRTYSVTTGASAGPLKLTLVWSDYAAAANAAVTLVNNLNLTVSGPGVSYVGNSFAGGWSATGGTADARNNVENVFIQSAQANTTYTVTVSGANVPQGPQPFALVVGGAATATDTTPAPTTPAAPTNLTATGGSRRVSLAWADNSSNETGFRIERCTGATCTNFAQIGTVGANVTSSTNTGLARNTTYRYRITAYNAAGASAYSNIVSATTTR